MRDEKVWGLFRPAAALELWFFSLPGFCSAVGIADSPDGRHCTWDFGGSGCLSASLLGGRHVEQEVLRHIVVEQDGFHQWPVLSQEDDLGPAITPQSDALHEADRPMTDEEAAVVIDHEDWAIVPGTLGQDLGDFVIAIEDRLDRAGFDASFRRGRHFSAEDQRQPFVGMSEGRCGNQCGDQAVDGAHSDITVRPAGSPEEFVQFIVGVGGRAHAATFL